MIDPSKGPVLMQAYDITMASMLGTGRKRVQKVSFSRTPDESSREIYRCYTHKELMSFPLTTISNLKNMCPEFTKLCNGAKGTTDLFFLEEDNSTGEWCAIYSSGEFRAMMGYYTSTKTVGIHVVKDAKPDRPKLQPLDTFVMDPKVTLDTFSRYIRNLHRNPTQVGCSMKRLLQLPIKNKDVLAFIKQYEDFTLESSRYLRPCLTIKGKPCFALDDTDVITVREIKYV